MLKRQVHLLPKAKRILEELGGNIKLARLRRQLSESQVAERAGVSRSTLILVEKGAETVRIGSYVQILFVLGLQKDLQEVAKDDAFGRKLQDIEIITKRSTQKRK